MKTCVHCGNMCADEDAFCDCGYRFVSDETLRLQAKSQKNMRYGKWWGVGGLMLGLLALLFPEHTGGFLLVVPGAMLLGLFQFLIGWFQAIKSEISPQTSHHKLVFFQDLADGLESTLQLVNYAVNTLKCALLSLINDNLKKH